MISIVSLMRKSVGELYPAAYSMILLWIYIFSISMNICLIDGIFSSNRNDPETVNKAIGQGYWKEYNKYIQRRGRSSKKLVEEKTF